MLIQEEILDTSIFFIIWSILNAIFIYIDESFKAVFSAIGVTAVIFLEGIISYSVMAFLVFIIEKNKGQREVIFWKIFYKLFFGLVICFSIWRFGIIILVEERVGTMEMTSIFFMNLFYIIFAVLIIWAFVKKIPWLKKALILFLWVMFFIFTFVICPALGESELTSSTLVQFLLVGVIFAVPNIANQYTDSKKSGVK